MEIIASFAIISSLQLREGALNMSVPLYSIPSESGSANRLPMLGFSVVVGGVATGIFESVKIGVEEFTTAG